MATNDEDRRFVPVHVAILTVSDSRTPETDRSGRLLADKADEAGHAVVARAIVIDERDAIIEQLKVWIADPEVDVVIATGGTGLTGRDVTPEAFQAVYEKEISGFGELFRMLSFKKIGTSTIQSRATAGVARGTYLFALPGLARRVSRRVGRDPGPPVGRAAQALQLRRADAAVGRTLALYPFNRHRPAPPPGRPEHTIPWAAGRGCGPVRFH